MSVYYCTKCDQHRDNDHSPCTEVEGELWCEECAAELNENEEM